VDELGTLEDAIAAAKKLAGQEDKDLELLTLPRPRSIIEKLSDSAAETKSPAIHFDPLAGLAEVPGLAAKLRTARAILRLKGERVWLMSPVNLEVK
jgi:ClpP class serine protease